MVRSCLVLVCSTLITPTGPPSQSLGVDPVDPAVMRRPPRRKDEPIISRRLLARVAFSASLIVFGTLFVYVYALSDDHVSRREQTMVCRSKLARVHIPDRLVDLHWLCLPRSCFRYTKPRAWMRPWPKPDVAVNCRRQRGHADRACLRTHAASGIPNGGAGCS
jgi:hypothetical protein